MTKLASERQVSFITTLVAERGYGEAIDFATLTSGDASSLITNLLAMKRVTGGREVAPLELGVYCNPKGVIYRVHKSRETGALYAKMFDIEEMAFVYAPGAVRTLTAEMKMTLEEAKRFGVETGICCVCGAYLTDAKSVAEGIGPVCAKRF
jgi:hypothetical protein